MDKWEALDWFLRRRSMGLDDKCQQAENVAIDAIMDAIRRENEEAEDRERPPLPPIRKDDLCLIFLCPECGCDLRHDGCERCYRCGRRIKWDA